MKRPLSAYAKVAASMVGAIATALAATLPNTTAGKWGAVVLAVLVAMGLVQQTRNTQTVETGPGDEPKVSELVNKAGATVGTLTADTGAAAGAIVAGTTGSVGKVLDATLGKIIPGGSRRT